jgi:predicted DNA-binding protein
MYSPKVPEELIPRLYRLGKEKRKPMTRLIKEAVISYLAAHEAKEESRGTNDLPDHPAKQAR